MKLYIEKRLDEMPEQLAARVGALLGPSVFVVGFDCDVEHHRAEPEINVPERLELLAATLTDPPLAEPMRDAVERILEEWVDGWVAGTDPSYAPYSAGNEVA